MPTIRPTRRAMHAMHALAAAAASAFAFASPALAADAPTRTIAVSESGGAQPGLRSAAVSADGREVLLNGGVRSYVRDVAAGTTTVLHPSALVAASSDDLRRVLLTTSKSLDPRDTDQTQDFYVLDRPSGQLSFVSDVPQTLANGNAAYRLILDGAQLSGDGSVVYFRSELMDYNPSAIPSEPARYEYAAWRYAVAGGELSKLATTEDQRINVKVVRGDRAGRVAISSAGALVDGRKVALPYNPGNATNSSPAYRSVVVSADGSAIAVHATGGANANRLSIVRTSDGAVTNVTVPSWLKTYTLHGVGDGGSGVVLSTSLVRDVGQRQVVGWLTRAGVLSQVGGDILATADVGELVVSPDVSFAANGLVLAQLKSAPLPGSEPTLPKPPLRFGDFASFTDVRCYIGPWGEITWYRATASLRSGAIGLDPRTAVSATVRVVDTAKPTTVYADFTLAAGAARELYVPRDNGWTATATITFSDGTKVTGSYAAWKGTPNCDRFSW